MPSRRTSFSDFYELNEERRREAEQDLEIAETVGGVQEKSHVRMMKSY